MNIQDNVIRNALKNVYFVCGNACAGKSTIARMIADKHGFELYDMDALTGGFNLQIAFSTGALAGQCAAEWVQEQG